MTTGSVCSLMSCVSTVTRVAASWEALAPIQTVEPRPHGQIGAGPQPQGHWDWDFLIFFLASKLAMGRVPWPWFSGICWVSVCDPEILLSLPPCPSNHWVIIERLKLLSGFQNSGKEAPSPLSLLVITERWFSTDDLNSVVALLWLYRVIPNLLNYFLIVIYLCSLIETKWYSILQ